jgi:hypothetical protein
MRRKAAEGHRAHMRGLFAKGEGREERSLAAFAADAKPP